MQISQFQTNHQSFCGANIKITTQTITSSVIGKTLKSVNNGDTVTIISNATNKNAQQVKIPFLTKVRNYFVRKSAEKKAMPEPYLQSIKENMINFYKMESECPVLTDVVPDVADTFMKGKMANDILKRIK